MARIRKDDDGEKTHPRRYRRDFLNSEILDRVEIFVVVLENRVRIRRYGFLLRYSFLCFFFTFREDGYERGEILRRKEIDEHLAALLFLFDAHARAELFRELFLYRKQLRRKVEFARAFHRNAAGYLFRLAHGRLLLHYLFEKHALFFRPVDEHE